MTRIEIYLNGEYLDIITDEPISLFETGRTETRSGQFANEQRVTFWGCDQKDHFGAKKFFSLSPQNCAVVMYSEFTP